MRTDGNICGGSRVVDPADSGSFGRIRIFQWVGSGSQSNEVITSQSSMFLRCTYIGWQLRICCAAGSKTVIICNKFADGFSAWI